MLKRSILAAIWLILAVRADAGEIRVSAAASLKDVLVELTDRYGRQHAGVRFVNNFGATGTLAKQIENGAPADIYIAANQEWIEYLKGKGLLDAGSIGPFAFNALVFAGRGEKKAAGMSDLPRFARIAIGSPKSVPAGEYALEAMRRAGVAGQLEKKLVMARDVREALMYAERGEVDGAFVYRTDVLQGRLARILFTVPPELHSRISYPMGLTMAGSKNRDAAEFFRFLRSGEARSVLGKHGFEVK